MTDFLIPDQASNLCYPVEAHWQQNPEAALEAAGLLVEHHRALGLKVVPLQDKNPSINGKRWQDQSYTPERFVKNGKLMNAGLQMHYGGLCEIDIDTEDSKAVEAVIRGYGDVAVFRGRGEQRRGALFKITGRPESSLDKAGMNLKVEGGILNWRLGGVQPYTDSYLATQSAVYGVHPSGQVLWLSAPISDMKTLDWGEACERWDDISDVLCWEVSDSSTQKSLSYSSKSSAAPSARKSIWSINPEEVSYENFKDILDEVISASMVLNFYSLPYQIGKGAQPCPACLLGGGKTEEPKCIIRSDDFYIKCHHINRCPAGDYVKIQPQDFIAFTPWTVICIAEGYCLPEDFGKMLDKGWEIIKTFNLSGDQK